MLNLYRAEFKINSVSEHVNNLHWGVLKISGKDNEPTILIITGFEVWYLSNCANQTYFNLSLFHAPFYFLELDYIFLESLEHRFIKVLKIQTGNQMST